MRRSGFVLAGGASSRMGRDKALLAYRETTLVEYVARTVQGGSWIGGSYRRSGSIPRPWARRLPRQIAGLRALGGVYTALRVSPTDWNLIVACDMPRISVWVLRQLIDPEAKPGRNCVMAVGPGGEPEPLCAVYHRRCLPVLLLANRNKRFKMRDLVPELGVELRPVDTAALANVNTPDEWAEFEKNAR